MSEHQAQFQALLRELFQFDSADLDFGIYRIMNHKRTVIERYIAEDLPKRIEDELSQGALLEQRVIARQLGEVQKEIREALGRNALDSDSNLQQAFHETPLGERYLGLKRRQEWHVAHGPDIGAAQATLYQHLYGFFSRYYDDGDIVSKRRYSRRERYAIPYNGEEVHLHWANKDQYYVKTGEHFRDYAFKAGDVTVRFAVVDADVEQGNVKGEKRYFFPRLAEAEWRDEARELHIPFEFRPATSADKAKNGQNHLQEALIAQAVEALPQHLDDAPLAAVTAERHRSGDNAVSLFEYHMRRYTRRNTTDFFIHKDLKGFLSREFDFYLKNEVLNIDGVETTDPITAEGWARGWFQMLQLMKMAAGQVIDFLSQVETFQKTIWEKRKFVTDAQYCISLRMIDARFHAEIAKCEAQWEEWKRLYAIDEAETTLFNHASSAKNKSAKRLEFLADHPSLVLDTAHFDEPFCDELLASLSEANDLDELTDGVLVQSENFQALGLLGQRYRGAAQCVYLDPPYNTDASAILYKNDYKDSAWLSLMADRLPAAKSWLTQGGVACVAIDDEEASRLRLLMQQLFEVELGVVAVRSNPAGRKSKGRFSPSHEYAFFFGDEASAPSPLRRSESQLDRYPLEDDDGRYAWNNLRRHGSGDRREDRPKLFYPIYVDRDDSIRVPELRWDDDEQGYDVIESPAETEVAVLPVVDEDGQRVEKRWHRGPETVADSPADYRVRRTAEGIEIDFKIRADDQATPSTWWHDSKYASANRGPRSLKDLFGEKNFDFAKAVPLVEDCLRASGCAGDATVLDFFAGSGTTAHAVANLNREDGGRRRFVLVEMGEHFKDVVLPRVKKVMFSPDWNAGRPQAPSEEATARSPRIVKYLRLESYDDALNNIEFAEAGAQRAMELEDYLIKYMLEWETRDSATLLNIEQLSCPFDYRLAIHANGANGNGGSERADVAETFNYLLGLKVRTRKVVYDDERKYLVYRGMADRQEVVVIWRATEGWEPADYRRDQQFIIAEKLADGADAVYANGICFLDGAQALEPLFKERMFAPLS